MLQTRRREADEFYAAVIPASLDADAAHVMRQALAGMLWSKEFYHYDVDKWLEERGSDPFKATRKVAPRNDSWHHMYNGDVISMPDKWEYPWYAAWDLAFHVLALTLVDAEFGKQQLKLMLRGVSANHLHGFERFNVQNFISFPSTWRVEYPHTSVTAGGSYTARRQ
jgi:hypothetical protein